METILSVRGLKKEYGSRGTRFAALHDVDLEVQEDEFLAVMGPSGSGKTTLLNLMSTIDQATAGEIYIEGRNLTQMKNGDLAKLRLKSVLYSRILTCSTVGLSLLLPLLLGIVHSLFAINVLKKFLNYNLLLPTLAAIAVFFTATTKSSYRLFGNRVKCSGCTCHIIKY